MGYREYKDMFYKAQKNGKYHMFVYDIANSRKGFTVEERISVLRLIFNVYERIEKIEKAENRTILHRSEDLVECKLKRKIENGVETYIYDHSAEVNARFQRADLYEPFYLLGDLYGFTIERGSLTEDQIDTIFEEEKTKLGIKQEFHKSNGFYETDKYEEGSELYFRGYCIQQLEEIGKIEKEIDFER